MPADHVMKEVARTDTRLQVPAAALQRYEEAVFRVTGAGALEPANPVAAEFAVTLSVDDKAKFAAAAATSAKANRAMVDMVDVGDGDKIRNLQVTLVPLSDAAGVLLFVRDLTLDNSLRLALVDSRRRYKDFIDISADFAWEVGADRRFAFVSPRGALGYNADELTAVDPGALTVEESTRSGEAPFFTRRRIENEEYWLKRTDGRSACVVISAMPLTTRDGNWIGARGVCRDVTETREREATLARVRNRERVLTRIVHAFRDEVNPEAMLGVAAEALAKGLGAEHCQIFRTIALAADEKDPAAGFQAAARYGEMDANNATSVLSGISGGAGAVEMLLGEWQVLAAPARYQNLINGVTVLWRRVDRGTWSDDDRLLIGDIANQIGITIEQLVHHEHVLRISRTDALTGLLNRGAFMDSMKRFLSRLRRDRGPAVLIYVDLDNFKHVNDTRGHQAGDDLLMKIREILVQHTRPTDLIARLGGDEFAVWLNGADIEIAKTRVSQFLERTRALSAVYSGSAEKPLGMSLGIAVWDPNGNEELDELLARADAAMYQTKHGGKGNFTIAAPAATAKA